MHMKQDYLEKQKEIDSINEEEMLLKEMRQQILVDQAVSKTVPNGIKVRILSGVHKQK